jgi:hypothetical protein
VRAVARRRRRGHRRVSRRLRLLGRAGRTSSLTCGVRAKYLRGRRGDP